MSDTRSGPTVFPYRGRAKHAVADSGLAPRVGEPSRLGGLGLAHPTSPRWPASTPPSPPGCPLPPPHHGIHPSGRVGDGNQVGRFDSGLVLWLAREQGLSPAVLDSALKTRSGLLGLAGTKDMQEVIEPVGGRRSGGTARHEGGPDRWR